MAIRREELLKDAPARPPGMVELQRSLESHFLSKLEYLNAVGIALSQERDINTLLETILIGAKNLTRADGGTLYRLIDDKLQFEIVRTDSLSIAMGGTSGNPIPFYPIPLHDKDGEPNYTMIAAYAALTHKTVNVADAYTEEGFDFSGTRNFDKRTGYRSTSFLTVPMKNHEGDIIGVLQLLNATDPATGCVTTFGEEDQRLAESLASQAAIALTNRLLIQQLEVLFESLIELINTAIDEKSPYTGGHCSACRRSRCCWRRRRNNATSARRQLPQDGEGPLRVEDRGPAARLRQDHHTRARRRTRPPSCRPSTTASSSSSRVSRPSSASRGRDCARRSRPWRPTTRLARGARRRLTRPRSASTT